MTQSEKSKAHLDLTGIDHFVFLDVDGVLVMNHGDGRALYPGAIDALTALVENFSPGTRIVLNSAWNVMIPLLKNILASHGFRYNDMIIGRTPSSGGGGEPIQDWATKNLQAKTLNWVTIDDSSDYRWVRSRHVFTDGRDGGAGLGMREVAQALSVLYLPVDFEAERARAIDYMSRDLVRIWEATPWLTQEQKIFYMNKIVYEINDTMGMGEEAFYSNILIGPDPHGSDHEEGR